MKKLVCDRCGKEITDKASIELAMEGTETWINYVRAEGSTARGFYPCENHIRCSGEMILISENTAIRYLRKLVIRTNK